MQFYLGSRSLSARIRPRVLAVAVVYTRSFWFHTSESEVGSPSTPQVLPKRLVLAPPMASEAKNPGLLHSFY